MDRTKGRVAACHPGTGKRGMYGWPPGARANWGAKKEKNRRQHLCKKKGSSAAGPRVVTELKKKTIRQNLFNQIDQWRGDHGLTTAAWAHE